jgi:hypothetical protein
MPRVQRCEQKSRKTSRFLPLRRILTSLANSNKMTLGKPRDNRFVLVSTQSVLQERLSVQHAVVCGVL